VSVSRYIVRVLNMTMYEEAGTDFALRSSHTRSLGNRDLRLSQAN
jgi:hypothetical protein